MASHVHWGKNPHGAGAYCDICDEALLIAGVTSDVEVAERVAFEHMVDMHPEDVDRPGKLTPEQQEILRKADEKYRFIKVITDPLGVERDD